MSIYGSWRGLDCEHEEECGIWKPIDGDPYCVELGDPSDCTCGLPLAPYVYQGSHILPALTDPKGGAVEIASIPDHITRDGRDDGAEGPKDWLRFGCRTGDGTDGPLLLTRPHVEHLRDTLTAWLDRPTEGAEQ